MPVGTIVDFWASWSSGIATLVVDVKDKGIRMIHCENAQTVRAFAAAFGDEVIGDGHTVNVEELKGKVIKYETDGIGMLSWFNVVKK